MQSYDNISQAITVDYGNVKWLNRCDATGYVIYKVLIVE